MEQWQINAANKCAKDGNLPKGFPFNKAQVTSMLGINPAEFMFLHKEKFIERTAPDQDSYITTDKWDTLKKLGSYDAMLAIEEKEKQAAAPQAEPAKTQAPTPAPAKAEAPKPVASTPAPAPEATKKEAAPQPVKPAEANKPTPATTPAAPKTEPKQNAPAPPAPASGGMDMVTMITLAAAVLGLLVILYSSFKK